MEVYNGKHINAWKLCSSLVSHFGGKKIYESVTYKDKRENKTSYFYLDKLKLYVRASDHLLEEKYEKRNYQVEIILGYFNLDFTINGLLYYQPKILTKGEVTNIIIQKLNELK